MSVKMKNRRATEAKLGSFIENLTVSEQMVTRILDSEVSSCRVCHHTSWASMCGSKQQDGYERHQQEAGRCCGAPILLTQDGVHQWSTPTSSRASCTIPGYFIFILLSRAVPACAVTDPAHLRSLPGRRGLPGVPAGAGQEAQVCARGRGGAHVPGDTRPGARPGEAAPQGPVQGEGSCTTCPCNATCGVMPHGMCADHGGGEVPGRKWMDEYSKKGVGSGLL